MNLQQFSDELRKNPEFVIAELQLKLDAANKKIAELEAQTRWIPVSERLPEKHQRGESSNDDVLVCVDFGYPDLTVMVAHYGEKGWCSESEEIGWHIKTEKVICWMPLSNPPEVTNE